MSATYYERKDRGRKARKSWVVVVRWQGERETTTVHSKQDAKDLVKHIHEQETARVNVIEAMRQARNPAPSIEAAVFPTLREALPAWIARQERAGEIRGGTPKAYGSRLATWVFP